MIPKTGSVRAAVLAVIYGSTGLARAATGDDAVGLQEVVVTATRRETSVLDIPYSIQAVTGQDLTKTGTSDLSGLVRLAPGLTMLDEGPRASGNRNTFSIRGLNANTASNNDDEAPRNAPAVSTYLGETPVFFPFKLVDLNRVEILRGPQGTLYGESSIGGTVRLIPNAPDPKQFTLTADAMMSTAGHTDKVSYDGSATMNLPINDRSALRATIGHEFLAGFIDARGLVQQTGTPMNPGPIVLQNPSDILNSPPASAPVVKDHNDATLDYLRASALFEVSDRVTLGANVTYQRTDAKGRYEDNPYFGLNRSYENYKAFTDPQVSTVQLFDIDAKIDLGFATLTSATGVSRANTRGVSESSGYLRTHLEAYYFGYPRLFVPISRRQKVDNYTQELRLVSETNRSLDWIAGVFYKSSHTAYRSSQYAYGLNEYTNAFLDLNPPVDFGDELFPAYISSTFKEVAGFAELTWHVTDRWQVSGGFRVFHNDLQGTSGIPLPYASLTTQYLTTGVANDPYLLGGYNRLSASETDKIFKFGTSYKFNPETLGYLTISQGYRPGGANGLPLIDPLGNNNGPILTFKPDTDTNYEIGIKGSVAQRIEYSATAFLVDWRNMQSTLFTGFGLSYIANVAPARSQGVELEMHGRLVGPLSGGFNYAYMDASIRKAFEIKPGEPATTVVAGTPLPAASKNVLSAYLEVDHSLSDSRLVYRVDGAYKGPTASSFADLPNLPSNNYVRFPGFSVWSASVAWEKNSYTVSLFGENLSNSRGTTVATSAESYGAKDQGYGVIRPRTIGLRFNWKL